MKLTRAIASPGTTILRIENEKQQAGEQVPELLTYQQVAARLGVKVQVVRGLVASRKLACVRLGHRTVRFRPSAVDRCIEKLTEVAR